MSYDKKIMFTNSYGEQIYFDNKMLFCESIDTVGCSAVHTTESLAFADGQTTISHNYGAKTIPASFLFADRNDDEWTRKRIVKVFSSLDKGILTVWSKSEKFEIDCYIQEIPTIQKDSNVPYVFRWNVDFVADYPFWRRGNKKIIDTKNKTMPMTIYNHGDFDAPWIITYSSSNAVLIGNGNHSFTLLQYSGAVTVDSKSLKVTNSSGKNINYIIDPTTSLSNYNLTPGKNDFVISGVDTAELSFYEIVLGVI